ncbi:hypothetical protein I0C86_12120 [Plantactinospora sp. S1510]|uniref:Uncharacterized protein n=1 Tax=Plantactinospora alkalitolerans TaxID=2789879 RepID=A0ABS0GU10_9ACTN|nr:hypothetical protein [Plantactinospora alkalitolerans]MBF9129697.1 hypothetical protein [Plantactinospora alkalitolerans]
MSICQFRAEATIGDATHDVTLLYEGFGPDTGDGAGWMIDMPVVLSLVAACEAGTIGPDDLRTALQQMMAGFRERSGCCPRCDEATESYATAMRQYEEALEQEERQQAALTPESHPFIVSSSGKVHAWNCRSQPREPQVQHPGRTLQEYVHEGHGFYGMLGLRSSGASTRMTPGELTAWLARRQSPPKRCKLCEPALPGAYGSQASDVEAGARA